MASIEKRRKDATISAATMGLSAFGGLGISMGGPRTAIGYGERATSGANATNQILRDSLNIQRQIARNTSGGMGAATP